ncbi:hypothetical protein LguiA_026366 [Lonicera macranthoides]
MLKTDLNSELGCVFSCNAAAVSFHTLLLSGCFGNALGCVVTHLASAVMHWAKGMSILFITHMVTLN